MGVQHSSLIHQNIYLSSSNSFPPLSSLSQAPLFSSSLIISPILVEAQKAREVPLEEKLKKICGGIGLNCHGCIFKSKELQLYRSDNSKFEKECDRIIKFIPLYDAEINRMYVNFKHFTFSSVSYSQLSHLYTKRTPQKNICNECIVLENLSAKAHFNVSLMLYKLEGLTIFVEVNYQKIADVQERIEKERNDNKIVNQICHQRLSSPVDQIRKHVLSRGKRQTNKKC